MPANHKEQPKAPQTNGPIRSLESNRSISRSLPVDTINTTGAISPSQLRARQTTKAGRSLTDDDGDNRCSGWAIGGLDDDLCTSGAGGAIENGPKYKKPFRWPGSVHSIVSLSESPSGAARSPRRSLGPPSVRSVSGHKVRSGLREAYSRAQ